MLLNITPTCLLSGIRLINFLLLLIRSLSKKTQIRIVSFLFFLERLYTLESNLFNLLETNFTMQQNILRNLNIIKNNILKICKKINRNPKEINIVAVSKEQPFEKIEELLQYNHNCFGENRLLELESKWNGLNKKNLQVHFIGALQSRKVKDIIKISNVIETLDSESAAKKIASLNISLKSKLKLFIQINLGKEIQKRGIAICETENFLNMCREKYKLTISGGMALPPKSKMPEKYFQILRDLCEKNNLKEISMGMSDDYEKAIELGSTNIRIGTKLFGKRN